MSITKGIYLATVFVVSLSFAAANLNAQNAFNQISNENIQELLPEVQEWNESASANQQGNVDNLLGRFDDPENSDDVDFIDDDLGDQNQNLFGNDNSNGQGNAFESNPFGDNDGGFALDGDSQGNANSLDEENLFGGNETVGNTSGNEIDLTDSEPVNFGNNQQYVNLNNQQYVNLNNTEPLGIQLPEGVSIDQDSPLFRGAKRPGTRRILSPGEAPFEYTVKPGDTLYDICDQLIDDTNFWPKLWAANPQIHNPHFIRPGMRLRFYPGLGNPSAIADAHIKKYGSLSSVPPEAYAALNKTQASDAKAPPPAEVPKTQHVFEPAEIVTYIGKENFDEPKRLRIPSFITSTFDKDKLVYG